MASVFQYVHRNAKTLMGESAKGGAAHIVFNGILGMVPLATQHTARTPALVAPIRVPAVENKAESGGLYSWRHLLIKLGDVASLITLRVSFKRRWRNPSFARYFPAKKLVKRLVSMKKANLVQ